MGDKSETGVAQSSAVALSFRSRVMVSISRRMAMRRISVCVKMAARCGSVAAISSRILRPVCTMSPGCTMPYPKFSIALANAAFASRMTGAIGYRVSSKSKVKRPRDAVLEGVFLGVGLWLVIVVVEEDVSVCDSEEERRAVTAGRW